MSIQRIVKHFQFGAMLVSAAALMSACGEPLAGEEGVTDTGSTVTAFDIIPPTATMSCARDLPAGTFGCSSSVSNGVAPYRYQWQVVDDFGSGPTGPTSSGWQNGTTAYSGYCPWGLYTFGTYYYKDIYFRVLDANNYVSNMVTSSLICWTPN